MVASEPVLARVADIRSRIESGDYLTRVPHPGDLSDLTFLLEIVESFYAPQR